MYKETIVLPKAVVDGSASVTTEVVYGHSVDHHEEAPYAEPQKKDNPLEPAPAAVEPETPLEDLQIEMIREQNELLFQIKELLQAIDSQVQEHIKNEKNSMEKILERIPPLAFSIAEKIVHKKIKTDNSIIAETLRQILSETSEKSGLKITLNPNDVQLVRSLGPELGIEEEMLDKHWEIVASEEITPGGCLVRTSAEEIDARIETQLSAIKESILKVSE